jgi:putative ABC transport system permease protein
MKNILRNFWLTLSRFKTASILNILGLTVAFTVFMVIMTQTYWELTYNKGIRQHERIFRLLKKDNENLGFVFSRPLGEAIGKTSPSVEAFACVGGGSYDKLVQILFTQGKIKETKTTFSKVSPEITKILSLECIEGDFSRFEEPNASIIPTSLADVLFSENNAVGHHIIFPEYTDTLQIIAVYKDLPSNCTFKNRVYINMGEKDINSRFNSSYSYYFKLNASGSKADIEIQANKIFREMYMNDNEDEVDEDNEEITELFLEPFSNLYYSKIQNFNETGNKTLTNLLSAIAILIIFIALINYINFFMALVPVRIRSININKVFGTPTLALRLNIIGEAVGLLLFSFGLALLAVQYLSDTSLNELIITSLKISQNLFPVFMTAVLVVVTGILAGLFPAFFITKFNPILTLKGSFGRSKQGLRFRSVLIIFQFSISIILIIGAGFMHLQSRYMQKYDYGFNRNRLITLDVGGKIAAQPQTFLSELKKNPHIEEMAYAFAPIVNVGMGWGRPYNGESIYFSYHPVSWNYITFMGLQIVEGRSFMEEDVSKSGGTIIFNETAAKKYNIKVGDNIYGHNWNENAEIVGIVKDFNFTSLQKTIEPLALYEFGCKGWMVPSVAHIRLSPDADFQQTSEYITSAMQTIDPGMELDKISIIPFDMTIENLYTKEIKLTKIISLFSVIAIIISLMGVFGIVVFENQHRKKEIALRKIHGSTAKLIIGMFNRKFISILLISFVIAAPIAYFAVVKWLSGFAYRTPIYWWVFALGFLVVAFITLLTVTLQTFHTANENPVKAVKSE